MNVMVDARGTLRRRPGITATVAGVPDSALVDAVVAGAPITGLHEAATGDTYGVFGYDVMRFATGGVTKLSPVGLTTTTPGARPVFAETEMLLLLAQSADLRKIELASPVIGLLGGSPPIASHVIANSDRLLGNDGTIDRTKVRYSDIALGTVTYAGHEIWLPETGVNTSGYFTAESRPDAVVAIGENTAEVFVWGTETLQIFASDPSRVFAPVRALEVGCRAPYSIVKFNSEFYWLDSQKRFVHGDGQSFEPVTAGMENVFKSISRVDDCFGFCAHLGMVDVLAWTFPTDGRTFVYQPGVGWGQWASWNEGGANWAPFTVTAHHQRASDAANLVGTSAGKLGAFDLAATDDLGVRINAYVETGFTDRGTSKEKLCRCVRLILKRGTTTTSGTPRGFLWYRDKPGDWQGPIEVELGASGDSDPVVTFQNLGKYRTRQWRFQFDGPEELLLVRAEEDFDVLSR